MTFKCVDAICGSICCALSSQTLYGPNPTLFPVSYSRRCHHFYVLTQTPCSTVLCFTRYNTAQLACQRATHGVASLPPFHCKQRGSPINHYAPKISSRTHRYRVSIESGDAAWSLLEYDSWPRRQLRRWQQPGRWWQMGRTS